MQAQAKRTTQRRTKISVRSLIGLLGVTVPLVAPGIASASTTHAGNTIPSKVFALQVSPTTLEDGHISPNGSLLHFKTISIQNGSPSGLAIDGASALVKNVTLKNGKVVAANIDIERGGVTDHFRMNGGKAFVSVHDSANAANDAVVAERAIDAITSTYGQFTGTPVASTLGRLAVTSGLIAPPVTTAASATVPTITPAQEQAAIAAAVAQQRTADNTALLGAVTAQANKDAAATQAAVAAQAKKDALAEQAALTAQAKADAAAKQAALAAQAKADAARQTIAVQTATLHGRVEGILGTLVLIGIGIIGLRAARWLKNRGQNITTQLDAESTTPKPVASESLAAGIERPTVG